MLPSTPVKFKTDSSVSIGGLISKLFASRTQTHILHLNTTSFEAHTALNDYYDGIVGLTDSIAESYQGKNGIITGYTTETINEKANPIEYLTGLVNWISTNRNSICSESYIQNQIDGVVELCYETLYKLKNLK